MMNHVGMVTKLLGVVFVSVSFLLLANAPLQELREVVRRWEVDVLRHKNGGLAFVASDDRAEGFQQDLRALVDLQYMRTNLQPFWTPNPEDIQLYTEDFLAQ